MIAIPTSPEARKAPGGPRKLRPPDVCRLILHIRGTASRSSPSPARTGGPTGSATPRAGKCTTSPKPSTARPAIAATSCSGTAASMPWDASTSGPFERPGGSVEDAPRRRRPMAGDRGRGRSSVPLDGRGVAAGPDPAAILNEDRAMELTVMIIAFAAAGMAVLTLAGSRTAEARRSAVRLYMLQELWAAAMDRRANEE